MHVLIITNSLGGLYNFRRELILKLIDSDCKVSIVSPKHDMANFFIKKGCNLINSPIQRRGTNVIIDLKLLLSYIKIIKKNKPDVILTYTIKPNIYGGFACQLLKTPYIATITGLGTAVENPSILQKFLLFLYRLSLKKARYVFFQNETNLKFLTDYNIATHNNFLVPGSGVNLKHFNLLKYPNKSKIRFLFIGRVMKEKGIEHFLETATYIKKHYSNTEFHIIGRCEEDYLKKLKEMEEKNIIKYHGEQKDVREFHKISHCTIHPTYYPEGMSNVLLESAASGRPVITTNRSGCREIVDDGVNGYVVEQKNSQDLIAKVEKFLDLSHEQKKEMGLAGRKKVEREFDREIVVNAYLKAIKSADN